MVTVAQYFIVPEMTAVIVFLANAGLPDVVARTVAARARLGRMIMILFPKFRVVRMGSSAETGKCASECTS